ncbi:MAG: AMP-binding protein, partial [Paracoccaceae bacterium]
MANTLFDALFAPLAGRKTTLLILPDGAEISGDAFFAMVAQQAHALRAAGLGTGDRIAVQVAKTPQALAVYGAAVALGAVFLPLNTAYTADEINYFLGDATPRIFLCDATKNETLAPVAARHGAKLLTLNADGSGSLTDAAANQPRSLAAQDRSPDDLAALLYTSGTTGRSKGAMLTHRNLLSNAEVLAKLWQFTQEDVLLHALPIFHTHGLFVASNTVLLTGGAMIFLPGFDLDAVLRLMPRATAMMGVPTFYTRLLDDPRFTRDAATHMRLFISGSAPLLAETHDAISARTGHRILERYGMTETNMNTSNPYVGDRRAGTVGLPLEGVALRIMAEGAEVAPGTVGVIEVRGPNVFAGYWQMPEKTAEELRPDGWFITGDVGVQDADGYVSIVGRQKDLIITGGFNVYPKEVELLLDTVPGVLESAVIGLPHPDFGEAVFA